MLFSCKQIWHLVGAHFLKFEPLSWRNLLYIFVLNDGNGFHLKKYIYT